MKFIEHHRYGPGFFEDMRPEPGEKYTEIFYDQATMDCQNKNAVAVLLEPRALVSDAYEYVESHPDNFKYIFTHDSRILKNDNARLLNWSNVWLTTDSEKTKNISICSSWKDWCPLHKARLELAREFDYPGSGVDCFGNFREPPGSEAWTDPRDYLEHYKFSIVIENDIDDYWITEKVLNCFATKTVPIYVGSPKISGMFNPLGIIQVPADAWENIPLIISKINADAQYKYCLPGVEDNYKLVEPWKVPWKDRFLRDYAELLEGAQND